VASAADIIFHCVRSQLIFGEGLPLGLVGSGFNFTQLRSVEWPYTSSSIHSFGADIVSASFGP
jgi:hypothetical protein